MTEYKHINYNPLLQDMKWVLEQVDETWKLCEVITYSVYEYVAVFERVKTVNIESKVKIGLVENQGVKR